MAITCTTNTEITITNYCLQTPDNCRSTKTSRSITPTGPSIRTTKTMRPRKRFTSMFSITAKRNED